MQVPACCTSEVDLNPTFQLNMSQPSNISKILFIQSCGYLFVDILYYAKVYGSAKKSRVRPFSEPMAAFFNFDGSAALQAVIKCPLNHSARIWKYFQYIYIKAIDQLVIAFEIMKSKVNSLLILS